MLPIQYSPATDVVSTLEIESLAVPLMEWALWPCHNIAYDNLAGYEPHIEV